MKKLLLPILLIQLFACRETAGTYQPQPVTSIEEGPNLELKYSFTRLDLDKNGFLDFEEFFNIDKNNLILPSKREQEYKVFLQFDVNKDAYLDQYEFNNYKKSMGL